MFGNMTVWHAFVIRVGHIGAQSVRLGCMILSNSNDVCPTWNKSSGLLSSELSVFPVAEWGLHDNGVAYILQIKQSCNVNALFLADLLHLYVHKSA